MTRKLQIRTKENQLRYHFGYWQAWETLKTSEGWVRHLDPSTDSQSIHFIEGWNQALKDYVNTAKLIKSL